MRTFSSAIYAAILVATMDRALRRERRAAEEDRILLENYYLPGDLEAKIASFVEHYNLCVPKNLIRV